MAPTWETLAKVMWSSAAHFVDETRDMNATGHDWTDEEYRHAVQLKLPVKIVKVDCVEQVQLCTEQGIRAYPTLRLFVDGKKFTTDYEGHRTVVDFTDYLVAIESTTTIDENDRHRAILSYSDSYARQIHVAEGGTLPIDRLHRAIKPEYLQESHPGCQLSGFLLVNRLPGKFHIQARSDVKEFDPAMGNVSHIVHHLSFGEPFINRKLLVSSSSSASSPPHLYGIFKNIAPMEDNVYVTHNSHEAHHHYIKVVPTHIQDQDNNQRTTTVYQFLQQSQLTYVHKDYPPEAQFQYDISPIAVTYGLKTKKWYDYITSLMAILGGTFTVVGMMESSCEVLVKGLMKQKIKFHL